MNANVSSWAGRRVVVTGAGGFLGQRLVRRLIGLSSEVVALSRATGFHLLEDILPLEGVNHVFHLAAETGVPDSWDDPVSFHLVNSHGTVRVLDQCRRAGCGLTYVGAYIYGVPSHLPINEQHPLDPNNPYAFSKWMGEQACEWFARTYSFPVAAVRLFNVYGAGQSSRFLITRIIEQVLDPSCIEIELMDLAPRRDYLHVDDAVEALLSTRLDAGYKVYNVGSGASHSVSEIVQAVLAATGLEKQVRVVGEPRRNEIPDVRADCSRLRVDTGWSPRFTLESGIQQVVSESTS